MPEVTIAEPPLPGRSVQPVHVDLQRVIDDIAKAKQDVLDAETDLDVARNQLHDAEQQLAHFEHIKAYILENTVTTVPIPLVAPVFIDKEAVAAEAAETVLKIRQRPMKPAEIVAVLKASGYGSQYRDLKNSVYTGMDRKSTVFVRGEEPGTWALVEWQKDRNGEVEK